MSEIESVTVHQQCHLACATCTWERYFIYGGTDPLTITHQCQQVPSLARNHEQDCQMRPAEETR